MIKIAKSIRDTEDSMDEIFAPLKLYASPWSAPAWMKSNNALNGIGYLLPEYYQPWANYFVKFLNEYKAQNISFWGLTAQNEPLNGVLGNSINDMGWNSTTQREWIVNNLGPALESAGYSDIKLMMFDDQRLLAPKWAREVFADEKALKYVSGIAVHWYADDFGLPFALDQCHNEFPDKFILYTEACNVGQMDHKPPVVLGDWDRGERYLYNIIEDLNHWVVGWTDWNLALDINGGPSWCGSYVDSPMIIDHENHIFYKQPMYYALGHISRFVVPRSVRIGLEKNYNLIEAVAFKLPFEAEGYNIFAIIILNR